MAVGVEVGERELLQVVEGPAAKLEARVESEPVGHGRERPLARGRDAERDGDAGELAREAREVDLPRSDHAVDGAAGEHRQREGPHDHARGEHPRGAEARPAPGEEADHAPDGSVRAPAGAPPSAHRPTSSALSCESQISR